MVKAVLYFRMGTSTKEIFRMENYRDLEFIYIVQTSQFMRESSKMIWYKDLEKRFGLMGQYMKDNSKMGKNMVLVLLSGAMGRCLKETLLIIT